MSPGTVALVGPPSWAVVVATVIVAVLGTGGGVALFTARATARKLRTEAAKTGADSAAVISDTALSLLEPMKVEIARLMGQVNCQADEITRLTGRVRELNHKVDSLTDRLDLAQRLLTDAGIPFPPHERP